MHEPRPRETSAGRLAGLDGLRGLAMLMVIACHLNLLAAGWTGLSSFFVLSGFLITRILLGDRAQSETLGGYFRRFYIRRVLRVFPIYYVYLLVLTGTVLLVPALADVRTALPSAYLYFYNFHMVFGTEHTRTLGHLWSLSVEEQFYLLWPWLVAFVPRRALRHVCFALIALGPFVRAWVAHGLLPSLGVDGPRAIVSTYVFTLSHLDAFAFGALLNFVDFKPGDRTVAALLAVLLALGFAVNGFDSFGTLALGWPLFLGHGGQYTWGYTLIDLFWFVVIAAILSSTGVVKRVFTLPLFDYLGKRSYSTYIVHFPILALTESYWHGAMHHLGTLAGTLAFAVPYLAVVFTISGLCFRFIEMPMSELKERFRASRKAAANGAPSAGVVDG
jgi:peptidoglycan/LPS O-acetylase OafA/YrhL